MSKTSYFLIGVMVAVIAFMGALRGYRAYERWARERGGNVELKFQNVPVVLSAPQAEPTAVPVPYLPELTRDVFLEDAPLTPEKEAEQAHLTVQSILADYESNAALADFNAALSRATGGEVTGLAALSGPRLEEVMKRWPQVGEIIKTHSQNPEFAAVMEQIFRNPQFARSVRVLQGPSAQRPEK